MDWPSFAFHKLKISNMQITALLSILSGSTTGICMISLSRQNDN